MQGKHPTVTVGVKPMLQERKLLGKKGFRMCPRPARCYGETRRLGDSINGKRSGGHTPRAAWILLDLHGGSLLVPKCGSSQLSVSPCYLS